MEEKRKRSSRGQVEDLGGGRYRLRVTLKEAGRKGRARTYSEMFYGSPRQARKKCDELAVKAGAGLLFQAAPMTFGELASEWLEQKKRKKLAANTIYNYQDTLNSYLLPSLGSLTLKDLTPRAMLNCFNDLQDKGLADATIRHARAVLKLIIKYARPLRYIDDNPLEGLELPEGADPRETASLTPGEARKLVETAMLDLDDLVFVFALFTGLRPAEYLGLAESSVEERDTCAVAHITRQALKLRREEGHAFPKPKTKQGVREVPIPLWLYRELRRLKALNEALARAAGPKWQEHGLVFPSRTGRPMSDSWLREKFARLLKRAGLPPRYTPYSLRYTYNTLLYVGGVQDKPRSVLMGHKREEFNKEVYVKPLPEMFEGVSETLEKLIFGGTFTTHGESEAERVM